LKDLQEILNYFQELQKIDTTDVEPMSGGTFTENVVREDKFVEADKRGKKNLEADLRGNLVEAFPEKEKNFLKVPPVFE
jgi:aspartyl/glutamyl-tRNA(Asn/Gln) amidotransferase C subunit